MACPLRNTSCREGTARRQGSEWRTRARPPARSRRWGRAGGQQSQNCNTSTAARRTARECTDGAGARLEYTTAGSSADAPAHLPRQPTLDRSEELQRGDRDQAPISGQAGSRAQRVDVQAAGTEGFPNPRFIASRRELGQAGRRGQPGEGERVFHRGDHVRTVAQEEGGALAVRLVDAPGHRRHGPAQVGGVAGGKQRAAVTPGLDDDREAGKGGDDAVTAWKRATRGAL